MLAIRNSLIDLANSLSDEKIFKIFSFAEFIKMQNDETLLLENDEISELENIISKDEYFDENQLDNLLLQD